MRETEKTPRRGFLAQMLGAAGAVGLGAPQVAAAAQAPDADAWIKGVKGTHRAMFDFPKHMNGFGLLHIFNYLNTYTAAYKSGAGQVGAVGTFYGMGGASSIPLAFNDAMWVKYGLSEYTGVKDASGKPYTKNPFHRMSKSDGHLLAQALQAPHFALLGDLAAGCGIENLQKMGTTFLICNNALVGWTYELEARGKGKAPEIDKELRANMLPGVVLVPAMVIAIEKAQAAGITYNRQ